MFERASKKLGLEQAVLGTFEKEKEDDKPTQKEMEQLLKRGAYALLEDDNDQITQEFCSDDIEAILAKRTRTRVVEGAKTASWLNKSGMVVSKSKFAAEAGGDDLDMDDPMFWQKVMPDFVTPSIMMQKLNDLMDEIEGKVRGPGRGKGRNKKKAKGGDKEDGDKPEEDDSKAEGKEESNSQDDQDKKASQDDDEEQDGDEESDEEGKDKAAKLSRTYKLKVVKFMSDLKSMMQDLFDDEDEEGLSAEEKDVCQKLLLTISVKERVFNEAQRREARHYLKRMEGDRRRRCRTSDQMPKPPTRSAADDARDAIPEELRIAGRKRKKPRRKREDADPDDEDETPAPKRKKSGKSGYVGEDGYLHHSDSEADWSDVADDLYDTSLGRKDRISRKEAKRRRLWGAGDDAATAAGRPWPVFPRHVVKKVLATILEEVMKYDEEKGGVFSEPVSKEDFPEYFEQIKKPMDYSTMKQKLENGEYRSAQAMQKDFILILQNCRTFNASNSEIVKEARQQHLMRPQILKRAAEKHDLFLSEDGSVLEIFDDEKKGKGSPKKKGKGAKGEVEANSKPSAKKKKPLGRAKNGSKASKDPDATDTEEEEAPSRKPRIRIKMTAAPSGKDGKNKRKSVAKRKRESEDDNETEVEDDLMPQPIPKKSKKKDEIAAKKKAQAEAKAKEKKAQAEVKAQESKEKARKAALFSLNAWKKARSSLDGSFKAAREYLTSQGPWELPRDLPGDKFPEVAKEALTRFKKVDRYSVFAEPVSEDEAPGYFEIVDKPSK